MTSIALPDGRRLAWREAGSGPPLVLLHGWAMSSAVFAEALAALATDFRVLAPDLRGHGASDPADGYLLADFAADLRQWLDALGLDRFALLGWSLGGQVALTLGEEIAGRVERLLLVSTTPRFCAGDGWEEGLSETRVRAMARDLGRNYEKTMGDFFALQFKGETLPRERYRDIVDFAVRQGRLPEADVALAALETLRCEDLRDRLAAVDLPTLVVHGAFDHIIPVGAGRYLGRTLSCARCVELPETGHAPFLSRPKTCFRLWREFLA